MRILNRIVLSDVEPENINDLWVRENTEEGQNSKSRSLWWYATNGWEKLLDFDSLEEILELIESLESIKEQFGDLTNLLKTKVISE